MFAASVPFLIHEVFHIPVSPICQDIQLGNCYSGFPTPAHWLMPFAQSLSPHWALRPSLGASPAGIARQVGGREMGVVVVFVFASFAAGIQVLM